MKFLVRLHTVSEANGSHGHWAVKAKRVKQQRAMVAVTCAALRLGRAKSYVATLTRIAPRKLDSDNLQRSFKAVRDEVAHLLGINDGSDRIVWLYGQRKGKPSQYAVEIDVEELGEGAMEARP